MLLPAGAKGAQPAPVLPVYTAVSTSIMKEKMSRMKRPAKLRGSRSKIWGGRG